MDDEKRRENRTAQMTPMVAVVIGAGIGTAFFAAAENPVWIGVGAGIGVAIGAALQARK